MRRTLVALVLAGCGPAPDLDDCRLYGGDWCEAYRPQGLACGLASVLGDHRGASCQQTWDPAALHHAGGRLESAHHEQVEPCPPGHLRVEIRDHEAGQPWSTCASIGNEEASSGDLGDVAAGAVCGLRSAELGPTVPCLGRDPLLDGCPPGTRLRAVPDRWNDRLDPVTLAPWCDNTLFDCPGEGGPPSVDGSDPVVYCEVLDDPEGGCVDCPEWAVVEGTLCGLHARGSVLGGAVLPEVLPTYKREEMVDQCRFWEAKVATGYHDHLAPVVEQEDLAQVPTCLGHRVDADPPCPEPLALVCTPDFVGEPEEDGSGTQFSWCWCDVPANAQVWTAADVDLVLLADPGTVAPGETTEVVLRVGKWDGFEPDTGLSVVTVEVEFDPAMLSVEEPIDLGWPGSSAVLVEPGLLRLTARSETGALGVSSPTRLGPMRFTALPEALGTAVLNRTPRQVQVFDESRVVLREEEVLRVHIEE